MLVSAWRFFKGGTYGPHLPSRSFMPSGLGPGVSAFLKLKDRGGTYLVRPIRIHFKYLRSRSANLCLYSFNSRWRSLNACCFWDRSTVLVSCLINGPLTIKLGRGKNRSGSRTFAPEVVWISTASALVQPFATIDQSLRYVFMHFCMLLFWRSERP